MNENEPRVPAGQSGGGQWTDDADRKSRLVSQIKQAHPGVEVRTVWDSNDQDVTGIALHARHPQTGNVLSVTRSDRELNQMDEKSVKAWADKSVAEYETRQQNTRKAIATEREMGR